MTITQQWDNADNTVLCHAFKGWWNVRDYYDAFTVFADCAREQPHTVHYILDFTESDGFLGNLLGIAHDLAAVTPANMGVCVAVSPTYQTETMFNIARKVAPEIFGNFHYAANTSEARSIIWKQCQTFHAVSA
jgi:hypothetical protein